MTPDPYQMLFTAKWNVPQAAEALGLTACEDSWDFVKRGFAEYCEMNPPSEQYKFTKS